MTTGFAPPPGAPTIETALLISAPITDVWSILTGFARYGEWNRYITRIEGEAAAGATIETSAAEGPSGTVQKRIRVEALAPYTMHWVGGAASFEDFRGDHFFELEPVAPGETLLLHREYFTGRFAASVIGQFGDPIRRNFELFNQCLKEAAQNAHASV